MPRYTDHMGLVVTTTSAVAAARYADGVELLLLGSSPDAIAVLQGAVAADPAFGVALAALACGSTGQTGADAALVDALAASAAGSSSLTRRERQHIEIVVTALRGDRERARALGSEHLREFPADALVAAIIRNRVRCGDGGTTVPHRLSARGVRRR
jgi:hypothetical protein